MTFKGKATKLEPIITGLQVKWGVSEGATKVLVYGMKKGEKISAGTSELVKIYGDVKLAKVEAAEYYGIPVDVNIITSFVKPESYLLSQNYPNPFNAGTTIRFATPIDGKVNLKIYNVAGQLVREFNEFKNAGYHSITWDGNNSKGQKFSIGVYLSKLQLREFTDGCQRQPLFRNPQSLHRIHNFRDIFIGNSSLFRQTGHRDRPNHHSSF